MKTIFGGREFDLGYCTNIHPGESWGETLANIRNHTEKVRARVAPDMLFGIGLRLSHRAASELAAPGRMAEFREYLAAQNFHVFSINAFPYGPFHSVCIKEGVFAPDWSRTERLTYTNLCADLLCRMLPEGGEGSISTLPGSFKEWVTRGETVDAIVAGMAECALHLRKIHLRTGRLIHLGFEPEPLGWFETTPETVEFFETKLRPLGARHLVSRHGLDEGEALEILNTHLGVCYDTCHMAVEYETPAESLRQLLAAGIRISKVQVSSALRLKPGEAALAQLERFGDMVYLHQVLGRRRDGSVARWKDIGPALASRSELLECEELRVHCHVPLYMDAHGEIGSTADHIGGFFTAIREAHSALRHLEVETYTWDVLPKELRTVSMDEAIARELEWARNLLNRLDG